METEARETPEVAARLVERNTPMLRELGGRLRKLSPRYALAAGRGSSDAAAYLAKYLFEQRMGLPTVSAAPSIQSIYGQRLNLERALVLAISQSGSSPDLIAFCRSAIGPDVVRLGLINTPASQLAAAVDISVPLLAGPENSVAATKSCVAAMTVVFGLTAHWRNDTDMIAAFERAPGAFSDALARDWSAAAGFFDDASSIYVIGRGPGLAIAAEAALKLKETNGLHAEAVSAAELRHGPLSLAGPELRVVMFAPRDAAFAGLQALADELRARGADVLFICAEPSPSRTAVKPDSEPVLELLSMLVRFYLLVSDAALRRGRSPDNPPLLTKITRTN
jgi:glucosamine--fructose-6-phosphate aminotransferase (isomerizing)